jgi:glycosyltransferase involved in cell wall biosynthesis
MPLLSILIPAYNRPEWLAQALRSVLRSPCAELEILVGDDCSPRQAEIVSVLSAHSSDPRLRWFLQEKNVGWSANRNALVSSARGEYVLLLGDDDVMPEGAVERLTTWIGQKPGRDIYAFGYEVIDEQNRLLSRRRAAVELDFDRYDDFLLRQFILGRAVPFWMFHPFTYVYRRELGRQFPYDPAAHIADDLLFLLQSVRAGKRLTVLPEFLFCWRKSGEGNGSATHRNLSSTVNGLLARARLFELLTTDDEWSEITRRLFPDGDFREQFLYDSLRGNRGGSEAKLLAELRENPQLGHHFVAYRNRMPVVARWRIRSSMVLTYLRINGSRGIAALLRYQCAGISGARRKMSP